MSTTNYYEIVAAFLVALFLTIFFSTVLRHRGPWGALWLVFVTIFLASWAGHLWINPIGPVVLGVSVIPIFIVGLIFAFVLAATTLPSKPDKKLDIATDSTAADSITAVAIGVFFWILVIILVIAIATGYYRMPVNSEQLVR